MVASMLAIVTPVVATSDVANAATPTPWTAGGPANVATVSDGSVTAPQMKYNLLDVPAGARFSDHTWTLSTTAASTFTDDVLYTYNGFHAFYQVRVHVAVNVLAAGVLSVDV